MLAPGFIEYLPNYLIVITISTLLTIFFIIIDYIWYSFIEGEWKFITEYVKYSNNVPLGSLLEYIMGMYIGWCAFVTFIYIAASLQTIGNQL